MKNIVLVDIDGTISKVGDRLRYITQKEKDWDSFYEHCDEDEPVKGIIDIVKYFDITHRVVYCTGRRESVRNKTKEWIGKHIYGDRLVHPRDKDLLMRKDGDKRHDTEAKPELLKEAGIKLEDIAFVLEDRNSMVKKWRELGLTCLQVADGDF